MLYYINWECIRNIVYMSKPTSFGMQDTLPTELLIQSCLVGLFLFLSKIRYIEMSVYVLYAHVDSFIFVGLPEFQHFRQNSLIITVLFSISIGIDKQNALIVSIFM